MEVNYRYIAQLLRDILDYLGFDLFHVPIPGATPLTANQRPTETCRRSLIRRIGSACKFIHVNRIYFQRHLIGDYEGVSDTSTMSGLNCPNIGDIGWIVEEDHDSFTRLRSDLCSLRSVKRDYNSSGGHLGLSSLTKTKDAIFSNTEEFTCSTPDTSLRLASAPVDSVTLNKISALEEELVKLRQVIADIATVRVPPPDVIPQGALTCPSTPKPQAPLLPPPQAPALLLPPPPPPPPPPPSLLANSLPSKSVSEVIAERKRKNGKSGNDVGADPTSKKAPSMTEVLKNLGSVKLKSVSRSPGGTPLPKHDRRAPLKGLMDPQTLIAAALKRKFAHRSVSPDKRDEDRNSEDKENSFSKAFSPSPVKAEFGQHLLKSRKNLSSPMKQLNL